MPLRAVLLDVDGTLVDSNDAHAQAWVDALAEDGLPFPVARVRPMIGMGGDQLLPALTGITKDEPRGKALSERRSEIFLQRYLPTLQAFAGAKDLVARLRARGLRTVVATSASEDEAKRLIEIAGIADLVDAKTTADDAEASKPAGDLIAAAVARAGVEAADTLLLGDTPYDIAAGKRAGVGTIALRCGGFSDAELAGATAIYDGPAALLAAFDRSLLA
jgi:HAD superfamily hydrolase (TIGR01509 family)